MIVGGPGDCHNSVDWETGCINYATTLTNYYLQHKIKLRLDPKIKNCRYSEGMGNLSKEDFIDIIDEIIQDGLD